jgi:hypothetical protein
MTTATARTLAQRVCANQRHANQSHAQAIADLRTASNHWRTAR